MNVTLGDVASSCGPNPCGMWDYLSPSSECETWQLCAANQNAGIPVNNTGCVVGGTDEYGDTIINCPQAPPCLMGSGPLQTGQQYCSGVLDAEQMAAAQYFASQQGGGAASGLPTWAVPALIGLLAVVVLTGRR